MKGRLPEPAAVSIAGQALTSVVALGITALLLAIG